MKLVVSIPSHLRALACAGLIACLGLGGLPAAAQDLSGAQARQKTAYDALLVEPDNIDLIFAYVKASIEAKDYESAITSLERILIYRPELTRVRVELGAAYFRLGAYAVSKFYFEEARAAGDLSPEEEAQIARFLEQIEKRLEKSAFAANASFGIVFATNANLGTSSGIVQSGGIPVVAPGEIQEKEDAGFRVVLNLAHQYDMGQPDGDFWQTDAQAYALQFFNEDQGNFNAIFVRTGPRLSLDALSHGPKIRPFAELEIYRADDQSLLRGVGAGLEYTDTINAQWSIFAIGRLQQREFFDGRSEFDGLYSRATFGAVYSYSPALRLRGELLLDYVETDEDFNDYLQIGLRAGLDYRYDPGFDWAERDWRATGSLQVGRRAFGGADARFDPGKHRRDTMVRFGLSNTAFLTDRYFARVDLDYTLRASNIANFDLDGLSLAFSFGRSF